MVFSILSWNIWYRNQVNGDARFRQLLDELRMLTDQYQPDFVALNEVVQPLAAPRPPAVESLQNSGYIHNFHRMIDFSDFSCGISLSSRVRTYDYKTHVISKNVYPIAPPGQPTPNKEIISAKIALPKDRELKIIVAHPPAIADSRKEHAVGMKNLEKVIRSDEYKQNTILVGDMNEWRLIPLSFNRKVTDIMHSRTGTFFRPTWHYNARRSTPLRLNLDYIYWSRNSDFSLVDFKVLPSRTSDHLPFLATFEYVDKI